MWRLCLSHYSHLLIKSIKSHTGRLCLDASTPGRLFGRTKRHNLVVVPILTYNIYAKITQAESLGWWCWNGRVRGKRRGHKVVTKSRVNNKQYGHNRRVVWRKHVVKESRPITRARCVCKNECPQSCLSSQYIYYTCKPSLRTLGSPPEILCSRASCLRPPGAGGPSLGSGTRGAALLSLKTLEHGCGALHHVIIIVILAILVIVWCISQHCNRHETRLDTFDTRDTFGDSDSIGIWFIPYTIHHTLYTTPRVGGVRLF